MGIRGSLFSLLHIFESFHNKKINKTKVPGNNSWEKNQLEGRHMKYKAQRETSAEAKSSGVISRCKVT